MNMKSFDSFVRSFIFDYLGDVYVLRSYAIRSGKVGMGSVSSTVMLMLFFMIQEEPMR